MIFSKHLFNNRWTWLLRGLPSLKRARAMFLARRGTMTTLTRCKHLWGAAQDVVQRGVPGSFVECGVWRGGSAATMAMAALALSKSRTLHLFDSFEGLPAPTDVDGTQAKEYSGGREDGGLDPIGQCVASLPDVENYLFNSVGLKREEVVFHQGWFQNTVARDAAAIAPIALLRLDGDWYESTKICLENLYPHLSPGGIVIMDDYYAWEGCSKATDEFRQAHGITAELVRIDIDAVCWTKP